MEYPTKAASPALSENRLLGLLLGCIVFHAAVQALTIGASLATIPIGRPVALSILAVAAVLGWRTWRWQRWQTDRPGASDGAPRELESTNFWPWIVFAAATFSYFVLLLASMIAHDFSCDGNTYHIPTIHAYLTHQRVHWIEEPFSGVEYMNGYPKGAELFTMVLVQALHPALLNAAGLLFLPLGSLGVAYLARRLGASSSLALLAGAAWVLLPVNMGQAGTTYVDSSHGSCVVAYLAVLYAVMDAGRTMERSPGWPRWVLAVALGSALGLATGVKSSGIVIGVLGLMGLLGFWIFTTAPDPRVRWMRRVRFLACFFGMVAITGAAVGGYWYLRNWVRTGSPLYPAGVVVAGHCIFPGLSVSECIGAIANTPPEIRGLSDWKATLLVWLQIGSPGCRWPHTIVDVGARLGGLGFLWLAGCVPATLWVLARALASKRSAWAPIVVLATVVAAAFLLQPLHWWARYTLWVYAVGLPCFAVAAHQASCRARGGTSAGLRGVRIVRLWSACCCVALVIEGAWSAEYALHASWRSTGFRKSQLLRNPAEVLGNLGHADWQSNYAPELNGTVIKDVLHEQQPVACGPLDSRMPGGRWKNEYLGLLSYPIGQRRVYGLPSQPDPLEITTLQRNKVHRVVWDDTVPVPATLCAASERVERVPGLIVFTLRSAPDGHP